MFEQSILRNRDKSRKPYALVVSGLLQAAAVGALVLAPLAFTQRLTLMPDFVPRPPLRAPKRAVQVFTEGSATNAAVRPAAARGIFAPRVVQPLTRVLEPLAAAPALAPEDIGGNVVPGWHGDFNDTLHRAGSGGPMAPPPPPPPPPVKRADARPAQTVERPPVRVSSGVLQAKAQRQPKPVYPVLARTARVQGVVRLIGVIARDGTIQQLQVVSGHPLLVQAALEAVRQWVYTPTLLNGEPVEVIAPIDVNFTLAGQ